MADEPAVDLELVSSDQLIDEILRRHHRMLIVSWKVPTTQADSDEAGTLGLRWRGLCTDAMGLCDYARTRLYEMLVEQNCEE